ncbi:ester cyclase [Sphaerisporangium sp. NPDC005289]|uniref:ester cyclase n=1 Tax=Sphaerisporangium sp. NPDC005289 TaxID=3155247 RepID=UPI0033AEB767
MSTENGTSGNGTERNVDGNVDRNVERNKETARRLYEELITLHRPGLLEELIAEDAVDETIRSGGGREDFRRHVDSVWATVEGVKATVTDLVAEGDRVVVFWRIEGVQRAPLFGAPASGRHFTGHSISTITFRDGKIVRYTVLPDRLGILQQIS